MRDIALLGTGFAIGVVLSGITMWAFWKGFFEGYVREVTMMLADACKLSGTARNSRRQS